MNPIQIASEAIGVIASMIADARAANDQAAVDALLALVADSAVGRELAALHATAQTAIDDGRAAMVEAARERADTPVMGVPAFVASDG